MSKCKCGACAPWRLTCSRRALRNGRLQAKQTYTEGVGKKRQPAQERAYKVQNIWSILQQRMGGRIAGLSCRRVGRSQHARERIQGDGRVV